jgi:hypothetical protein
MGGDGHGNFLRGGSMSEVWGFAMRRNDETGKGCLNLDHGSLRRRTPDLEKTEAH